MSLGHERQRDTFQRFERTDWQHFVMSAKEVSASLCQFPRTNEWAKCWLPTGSMCCRGQASGSIPMGIYLDVHDLAEHAGIDDLFDSPVVRAVP